MSTLVQWAEVKAIDTKTGRIVDHALRATRCTLWGEASLARNGARDQARQASPVGLVEAPRLLLVEPDLALTGRRPLAAGSSQPFYSHEF